MMHEKHGHGLFTSCQALSGSAQGSACQRDTHLTHRPLVTPVTTHAAGEGSKAKLQVNRRYSRSGGVQPGPNQIVGKPCNEVDFVPAAAVAGGRGLGARNTELEYSL
ncbi:hypothetical protein THARTR1_01555 [Trichoderma harzianum]|uniref:Uncharacterized protein n=1 Tax=Trichoderma harzianum TaxID=5544 RepID=A0A2K0UL77_TRIHA|nr:hypothetical protein THARTR1_01555 [Trichoderma harzianum]